MNSIALMGWYIPLQGGIFNCSVYLMESPIWEWSGAAPMRFVAKISRALMNNQARAWPISAKPRCIAKYFISVKWFMRMLTYIKNYKFIEAISFTCNSVGYVSLFLALVHSLKGHQSRCFTLTREPSKILFLC